MTADATSPETAAESTVVCPAVLDLGSAPDLRDLLLGAIRGGGNVAVHAADVTQVDTSALQILCAAASDLARVGRTLRVVAPSAAITRTAARLGVAAVLGISATTDNAPGT